MNKPRSSIHQFLRYIIVGGVAAVADAGTLYALYRGLGVGHLSAAAAGFLIGLIVNYLISILWVFESSGEVKQEFALFALVGLGGLAWTELILWVGVDRAHLPVMVSKSVALALVLVWNFGMRKKFVFAPVSG